LPVQSGDTVEIDFTTYNFPIEFSVAAASANLVFPEKARNTRLTRRWSWLAKL
jgi:hypothetical protein